MPRSVGGNYAPSFSPDGKTLAFIRDGRELRAIDLETKQERSLANGYLERPPLASSQAFAWSPDNKWIAYLSVGARAFTNLHAVPAAGGEPRRLTASEENDTAPDWAPEWGGTGRRAGWCRVGRPTRRSGLGLPRRPKAAIGAFENVIDPAEVAA